MTLWVFIPFLALAGLIVSLYIRIKKSRNEKLFCIIGRDCDSVVRSKYSSVIGIPNEVIGTSYYVAAFAFATIKILNIPIELPNHAVLVLVSLTAFIYSLYLSCVQIFVLKKICGLCLLANMINIIIFALLIL